ncbi:MAG: hypothetical protein ACTS27_07460 [Phycisphaerales bacterium]
MTHLKYIEGSRAHEAGLRRAEDESRTLRFPGAVRDVLSRPDPRVMPQDELVRSIDRTLDRMQDALNALAEDLDDSLRLDDYRPGGGPSSAA